MSRGWFPKLTVLTGALCLTALAACGGGGTPEAKSPDDEGGPSQGGEGHGSQMAASAEIGALDEAKVSQTFQSAQGSLQGCLAEGARRNELEGGDIAFFLKIGKGGQVVHARAEQSTIGDRQTEKCMLEVLKRKKWPEPQGGDVGLARNAFGFDMPNDVRAPTAWDKSQVESTVSGLSSKLSECKAGSQAQITATVYVDQGGKALSAGVASSDDSGEPAADCVAEVLKGAKYPSPGSWPAKVTFPL